MENFVAYNPTKLFFGKDVLDKLGEKILMHGKKVLLIYGKGSVLKNGSYEKTMEQLKKYGIEVFEYSGIKPNPIVEDVENAVNLGKEKKVELIIGLGGGSVIDSAKIVALSIATGIEPWDIMSHKQEPDKSLPLIAILTLAATGTEMNGNAVIQNHKTNEKIGFSSILAYPTYSFLDPSYTLSVPLNHTAYGIVDLIAHTLEAYFGEGNATLSDRFVEAIIKEAVEFGPKVLKDPNNYEYRANILWASTCALNGLTSYGRKDGDWGVHGIGHIISYLYDTPHGASLSIVYPAWMKFHIGKIPDRIYKIGKKVFKAESPTSTIKKFEEFFNSIGSPVSLREIGLAEKNKKEIINLIEKNKVSGVVHKLGTNDYKKIVDLMF